jgi:hypothetical protein
MLKKVFKFFIPFFITFALALFEFLVLPIIIENFITNLSYDIGPVVLIICIVATVILHISAVILTMVYINNDFKGWLLSISAFPAVIALIVNFNLMIWDLSGLDVEIIPHYIDDYLFGVVVIGITLWLPIIAALVGILYFLHKLIQKRNSKTWN